MCGAAHVAVQTYDPHAGKEKSDDTGDWEEVLKLVSLSMPYVGELHMSLTDPVVTV